jgi:hypothetical protein
MSQGAAGGSPPVSLRSPNRTLGPFVFIGRASDRLARHSRRSTARARLTTAFGGRGFGGDVFPGAPEDGPKGNCRDGGEKHERAPAPAPRPRSGAKYFRRNAEELALLVRGKLDHTRPLVRIAEGGENSVPEAKVWMIEVRALHGLGQAESKATKLAGRHRRCAKGKRLISRRQSRKSQCCKPLP